MCAGKTVAQAVCTPLSRADTLTLFDATTGQTLQSTCRESLRSVGSRHSHDIKKLLAQSMGNVAAD